MGLVCVMLNTRLRRDEIAYQLGQSDCRAVIVADAGDGPDFLTTLAELCPNLRDGAPGALAGAALPMLDFVIVCEATNRGYAGAVTWTGLGEIERDLPGLATDPASPAIISYSSGTTALPKGAMISHCLWRKAWDIGIRVDLTADDCLYLAIPMFGSMATMNGIAPYWVRGAKVVLGEQFDAGACLAAIARERVTGMHVLPPILRQLLAHEDFRSTDTSSLRLAYTLSIDPDILAQVEDELGVPGTITGYGMTETTTVVTRNRWDDPRAVRHATQGWPLPDLEVAIIDPATLAPMPAGEPGEIWVRGYSIMLGYYKKPEETARALSPDGWLRTGDWGRQDETGRVTLLGRLGDTYKSRGFNVSPAEVEYVLQRHPAVEACAIVGVPDDRHGEVGIAFVVPAAGATAQEDDLLGYLRPKIAAYKMPARVFLTDALPLTSGTGKVQKFKLRAEALERLGLAVPAPAQPASA
jgi:acyl-CoA synthetase (AMP-forming)/AMP-acid ligase II